MNKTYNRILDLMVNEEGVVRATHPSGKTVKVTTAQAKNRRGHPATRGERQETVTGSEAGLGTTSDIRKRSEALSKIVRSKSMAPRTDVG
jgi:hypothetical protein